MQMFNHGIITGALFLLVGIIYERAHTRDLSKFGGLGTKTPYFYGMMMVAGVRQPGAAGPGRLLGASSSPSGAPSPWCPIWAAFGVIGIVMTAVYILWRIIQNVFLGTV